MEALWMMRAWRRIDVHGRGTFWARAAGGALVVMMNTISDWSTCSVHFAPVISQGCLLPYCSRKNRCNPVRELVTLQEFPLPSQGLTLSSRRKKRRCNPLRVPVVQALSESSMRLSEPVVIETEKPITERDSVVRVLFTPSTDYQKLSQKKRGLRPLRELEPYELSFVSLGAYLNLLLE